MRLRLSQSFAPIVERIVAHRVTMLFVGVVALGAFTGAGVGFARASHAKTPSVQRTHTSGPQVSAASTANKKPRPATGKDTPTKPASAPGTTATAKGGAPAPAPVPPPITPSTVLGLANWKIALPIDTSHAGTPDEITQPELATFSLAPYFELTPAKNGVIFQANAGGATTKNSSYPRSELREMAPGGKQAASWSNAAGGHSMTVREAITHLPLVKPEVVAAQIHDASDDVVMVKLSGAQLFVEAHSDNIGTLDPAYALGTPYNLRITAQGGHILVYYNDVLKVDYTKAGFGWYFKAGCYTQSNVSKGDAPDAYAQVIIYGLSVSHV
jgi:hypothetical protein